MNEPQRDPLIVDDVMLLLFNPQNGAIVGDGSVLFHTLAGAVLVDLARHAHIEVDDEARGGRGSMRAVFGRRPTDQFLAESWDYIDMSPSHVHALVQVLGPRLREPVLERLVEHGHLRREKYRALGLFNSSRLVEGSAHRAELVRAVRAVLVDGADPDEWTATVIAMLSVSGSLAAMNADIPWSGTVHTRAKEMESRAWSASATGDAVRATTAAVIATNLFVSSIVSDR